MSKKEKIIIAAMRIIGVILIAYGLFMMFYAPMGVMFSVFGAVALILSYGKKCDYIYEAEQREIRRQERLDDLEKRLLEEKKAKLNQSPVQGN